mgnify:CR=1 FL=1
MPLITWTPQLSVGVQPLDNDHKLLVSLINQLHDTVEDNQDRDTVGSVLNALVDYTEYHFEREEILMRVCGYPDLEKHKKAHDAMKAKVKIIQNDYAKSETMDLGGDVLDFIKDWFSEHVQNQDKLYRSFMDGKDQEIEAANRAYQDKLEEELSKI